MSTGLDWTRHEAALAVIFRVMPVTSVLVVDEWGWVASFVLFFSSFWTKCSRLSQRWEEGVTHWLILNIWCALLAIFLFNVFLQPEIQNYRNMDDFAIHVGPDGDPKTVGFFVGAQDDTLARCVQPTHLSTLKESHKLVADVGFFFSFQSSAISQETKIKNWFLLNCLQHTKFSSHSFS